MVQHAREPALYNNSLYPTPILCVVPPAPRAWSTDCGTPSPELSPAVPQQLIGHRFAVPAETSRVALQQSAAPLQRSF